MPRLPIIQQFNEYEMWFKRVYTLRHVENNFLHKITHPQLDAKNFS